VPMFLWTKDAAMLAEKPVLEKRAYQTDELDWSLLSMMGVATNRDKPEFDLFGQGYKPWQRVIDGRPYVPGRSHITLPAGS
jgi:hypothetical protein